MVNIERIKPLRGWVLLEIREFPRYVEENGLITPRNRRYNEVCLVRKVGPGIRLKNGEILEPTVKPGDVVIVSNPAACAIIGKFGDSVYGFCHFEVIDAVLEEE